MIFKEIHLLFSMFAYNNLNQNECKIIIILIKVNLQFPFIKESTMSIYYC